MSDILLRLDAFERELAAVTRRLAQRERARAPLVPTDLDALARILPAIAGALGSEVFATRELFEREDTALHVALSGRNRNQVGQLFARAVGQAVDGFAVLRLAIEHGAKLWKVVHIVTE